MPPPPVISEKPAIATRAASAAVAASRKTSTNLVVTDPHYVSSDLLALDESQLLKKHGWSLADGDTAYQSGANSPGHKLRLTFASATGDLRQIVLGQINRPWPITYALSNTMFDRKAAMSMRLEVGAS